MGFKIKVNGEDTWESEFDSSTVTNVAVRTAVGESTAIGSPGGQDWIDIVFTTLSPGEELRFHSNYEAEKRRELSERIEEVEADRVEEGRQQMINADKDPSSDITGEASHDEADNEGSPSDTDDTDTSDTEAVNAQDSPDENNELEL